MTGRKPSPVRVCTKCGHVHEWHRTATGHCTKEVRLDSGRWGKCICRRFEHDE